MTSAAQPSTTLPLLEAMLNLTEFHREHEKFYSVQPREQAVVLQRHARTLHALADRWSTVGVERLEPRQALSPFEGAPDLNASAAIQLDGVLFMEGEGEPSEIGHLKREVRAFSEDARSAGEWLDRAMQASWDAAALILDIDGLGDMLGERHRIIENNWQAAAVMTLVARVLSRAVDVLDRVDFRPASLRQDLLGPRCAPGRVRSAAEMLDRAGDLLSEFAGLVHDNERRWRVFRMRVGELVAAETAGKEPIGP